MLEMLMLFINCYYFGSSKFGGLSFFQALIMYFFTVSTLVEIEWRFFFKTTGNASNTTLEFYETITKVNNIYTESFYSILIQVKEGLITRNKI